MRYLFHTLKRVILSICQIYMVFMASYGLKKAFNPIGEFDF